MDPKLGQVDADFLVVLGALVCLQVMLEGLGVVGDLGTIDSVKIIGHAVIEGEQRSRGTNLGAMLQMVVILVAEGGSTPGPSYLTMAPVPPLTARIPANLGMTPEENW